jgi:hypothetical protein
MVSEWMLGRMAGGVDWIQLAQDRDRWQALANTAMNLRALAPRSWLTIVMRCGIDDEDENKDVCTPLSLFYRYLITAVLA